MHVTFCAHDRPGYLAGGPNAWLLRLLPDLRELGISASIIVVGTGPPADCPLVSRLRESAFDVRFYDSKTRGSCIKRRVRWLARQLNDLSPQVFVPNLVIPAYHVARFALGAGIPTVGIIHSNDAFHHQLLEAFVYGQRERVLSAVVAVSKGLVDQISPRLTTSVGPELRRIPYGVPLPNLVRVPQCGPLRVCYVGRFVQEQKRVLDVTRSFCAASSAIPGATFTLVGDGPERKAMEEIVKQSGAEDRVIVAPPVASREIQSFLRTQDIFVLLSDYEGLPIALQEAMSVGVVPVCLFAESGIVELIEHGHSGLIVADREDSFVRALQGLAEDRVLLEKLGLAARRRIETDYASSDQHKIWARLLREMALDRPKDRIRIPWRLRLPEPHPAFRGEDRFGPPLAARGIRALRRGFLSIRLGLRPRARLRRILANLGGAAR